MATRGPALMAPPLGRSAARYRGATLLDSYGVVLPADTPRDAYWLARLAFTQPPAIVRGLMAMRDTVMARFGVRTSGEMRGREDDGRHIDFFPVIAAAAHEVEVGLDDRHLDFRAWITLDDTPDGLLLSLTTAAWAHNRLGRTYLHVITPFHIAIVRASLRRAATRAAQPSWRALLNDDRAAAMMQPPGTP